MLLHEMFFDAARRYPNEIALRFAGSEVSYREAGQEVERIADWLRRELPRGSRIAIHMHKSEAPIIIMLASLAAGMTYVPLDPRYPEERRRFILRDAAVAALFLDERTVGDWDLARLDSGAIKRVVRGTRSATGGVALTQCLDAPAESALPDQPVPAVVDGDDLAYILYTSGSTGSPKGVMISHANAASFVDWGRTAFDLAPGDRVAVHAQLNFDLPVFDVFVGLAQGATVCPIDEETALFPQGLMNFLRRERISVLYAVPSALSALADRSSLRRNGLPDLRLLLYAGEEFPPARLSKLMELLPRARVFNLYGPIETNVVTFFEVQGDHLALPRIPIGRPVAGADVFLVDGDGRRIQEAGAEGEIAVAGACVTPGYLGQPDSTVKSCLHVRDGGRMIRAYRTGDFGRFDTSGVLHFLGRRDALVKVRGFRVELGEIEATLSAHPGVAEAAVVARPDPATTNSVFAFIVPRGGPNLTEAVLLDWCRTRLPDYMHPRAIFIRDHLPRTNSGKIARNVLRQEIECRERTP